MEKNKGYPTKQHKINILKNGLTKYHRRTLKQINNGIRHRLDVRLFF